MNGSEKSIKFKLILNPFYIYALIWSFILFIRSFRINKVFPTTPVDLWVFIFLTIVFSIGFGLLFDQYFLKKASKHAFEISGKYPPYFLAIMCLIGFAASIIYSGSLPLIETLGGAAKSYKEFGIPTITPLVICATIGTNAIASVKLFYGKEKRLANFLIALGCLLMFVLIFSRGAILFCVASSALIAFSKAKFTLKKFIVIIALLLVVSFLFNIFGNIRQQSAWNDSSYIMNLAQFDSNYSWLSNFSWSIIYIDSPLGNLAYNMEYIHYINDGDGLISQLIPDLIAKRIYPDFNSSLYLPTGGLTVSSMYAASYKSFGLFGMTLQYIEMVFIIFICAAIAKRRTETFMAVTAILAVLSAMSFFDNMFMYSGFSFSILVIIVLDLIRYPNVKPVCRDQQLTSQNVN